ncbi:hypothetical protein D3C78_743770 [compost metagenome]
MSIAGQGEQADAVAIRRTCGDDQQVGAVPVDHLAQVPIEHETCAFATHADRHVPAAPIGESQGRGAFTGGDGRQPALLLRLAGRQQQRRSRQAGGGEEWRAEQPAADLLHEDGQLDEAQTQAAMGLGNVDRRPAQFGAQAAPQLRVVARVAAHCRAHGGGGGNIGKEGFRAGADHFLLFGKSEVHSGSGSGRGNVPASLAAARFWRIVASA